MGRKNIPPIWEVNGDGVKVTGKGKRARGGTMFPPAALKAPVQSPPRHVSARAPASPAKERDPQNQVLLM